MYTIEKRQTDRQIKTDQLKTDRQTKKDRPTENRHKDRSTDRHARTCEGL